MLLDNRPVFEMGKIVEVNVTADDINNGSLATTNDCAIARALNRVYPCIYGFTHGVWLVRPSGAYSEEHGVVLRLPPAAWEFIDDWDHKRAAYGPFSFDAVVIWQRLRY